MEMFMILNEREAKRARSEIFALEKILSSKKTFQAIVDGFSPKIISRLQREYQTNKKILETSLAAYENAKHGDDEQLKKLVGNNIGLSLIVARIAKGLSQKELAERLGLREQQIQRYEADRYQSISLANAQKIAQVLGVTLEAKFLKYDDSLISVSDFSTDEIKKILKHAKKQNWYNAKEDNNLLHFRKYINEYNPQQISPSRFRTGLNIEDLSNDIALVAWRARIVDLAQSIKGQIDSKYSSLDFKWLVDLVQLSRFEDGPLRAKKLLLEKGIVLVVEPQIQGLKLDGAAFLVNGTPIIALTLRYDRIDNFWFTLLHELGHIIYHFHMGLSVGFFDDIDKNDIEEIEEEANDFASELLIPEEIWRTSAARISKSEQPILKLAEELNIHPAIIVGRVRRERNNYKLFSHLLGEGEIRKWLLPKSRLNSKEIA